MKHKYLPTLCLYLFLTFVSFAGWSGATAIDWEFINYCESVDWITDECAESKYYWRYGR